MFILDEKYRDSLKNYHFIDLFAGIGGFHLALESFGSNCVFASEWDKHAQEVYEKNFGLKPLGDITKISEEDIPKHDILCGGFPCQAFSISGKQKGFQDTRGTLFFDIARIVKHHQPKLLFLENVANFEKHDSGNTLKVVIETLSELGYNIFYKVLNASNFSLAQSRERIYILGFRNDLKVLDFEFPEKEGNVKPLADFLIEESLIEEDFYINRNDIKFNSNSKEIETTLFNHISPKPKRIGTVNKGGQGERIYDISGHAITLSAYGGGIGAKTGIYRINNKIRRLKPRECANIQGFPEYFVLSDSDSQSYKQFGNSVAVNVLQSILKRIIDQECLLKTKELELVP